MSNPLFFHEYGDLGYNNSPENWLAMRPFTCAFTGHRPQHLSFKFDEESEGCLAVKARLAKEIEQAIEDGYTVFISGGALGVDTWAALLVLEYKKQYPFLRLELAIPCMGQESRWSKKDKARYGYLIDSADAVIRTSRQPYYEGCMRMRNAFMVQRSSRLIAVFNGKYGGTSQTITMAQDRNIDVRIIDA